MRFHSSCLFHTGQVLLVEFDLCAPTRLGDNLEKTRHYHTKLEENKTLLVTS